MKIIKEPIEKYLLRNDNVTWLKAVQRAFPNTIIGGGAARQIFLNEEFGSTDIDIYHQNEERQFFSRRNLILKINTDNAFNFTLFSKKIQLIKLIYTDDIEALFSTYDFACCMFAIKDDYIYYTEQAKEDALNKQITIVDNDNCLNLSLRIAKYLKKGYLPNCEISKQYLINFCKYCTEYQVIDPLTWEWKFPDEYTKEVMENIFNSFFGAQYPEGY